MKLAAVVVFYNPSKENIKYIEKYIDIIDKLYIVDNTEDDVIRVNTQSKIEYIKLNKNYGIAYALNVGAKKAIEENYKYLLTMDQDSKITKNIINKMKDFIENNKKEKIGLVTPYHDIGSTEDVLNGEVEDVLDAMTSGNIISLDAYQAVGGYKDWLFIDCVDTDYCLNLHKHGYKVLRLNTLVMKHELGNLVVHKLFGKKYPCYNHNPIRRYYIVRNNLYIHKMYHDLYPEFCDRLLRIQKGQVKRIIAFENNKINKLKMMYKGYKDFKRNIKGKLK